MAFAFIDKVLQRIELVLKYVTKRRDYGILGLKHLRTFLLCARKWHNHMLSESDEKTSTRMGSILCRLEDALVEDLDLEDWIFSFRQEIMEYYITLSDYSCSLQSDLSAEFIDSLLENMVDIRDFRDMVDALKEKMVFFKTFIRFAQLRGFEPWQLQLLYTHLDVVALNVVRLCQDCFYSCSLYSYSESCGLELKLFEMLQKIKPIDPQIRETYIQVLKASNLLGSSHALILERDKHVLGDFADSLLYNIGEALVTSGYSYEASLKEDQVLILYEGLRFLRTILTKHQDTIGDLHEKVKDLIGAAVNEAAKIVICSLLLHEEEFASEMDFALHNLLEKITLIKVITSAFIFSKTNALGFVDFLLDNLKELPTCKVHSIALAKDQIQTVQEDLVSLKSFLENILDLHNQDENVRSLWSRAVEVAYKTSFVILSLVVGDILDCFLLEFNSITEEINLIKMEGLKIAENHHSDFESTNDATKTSNPLPSQGSTPAINKFMVTLDDETNTIIEQLVRRSKKLDIISIVGMPGLGKTTLARKVYDDPSVRKLFHAHAWCVVSQVYKKKDLLLRILSSVDCNFSDEYSKKNEHELEEKLKKSLLKRRYVIVLDDVWDIEAWTGLERSLPNDANSIRILLTSRHADVAMTINPNCEPHFLRRLTDDESWDLLQKTLSCKEGYPAELGRKIAKNCKGLPLTVVIIAGILSHLDQDGWEEIAEMLSLSALSVTDECMQTLELSYRNLPDYLKSCFLYFGAFPEDEEIRFRDLIWLWVAEGFIKSGESKSLEDVAKGYMNDLIGRGLVMVSKERSAGGVKTCRIHDLLHEFCVVKAKTKKFFSTSRGPDDISTYYGQLDVKRLCMHSTREYFEKSWPFFPGVRSLLFFDVIDSFPSAYHISFIVHLFNLLEVLDLRNVYLGLNFPNEMALLVGLRYLALHGRFGSVPPTISDLLNLETLIIRKDYGEGSVQLPNTIRNMLKLRVLYISNGCSLDSGLAQDSLERSSGLQNLDTFSTLELSFGQSLVKIMRQLPNIRRLKCRLFRSVESSADCNRIVALDFLSRLESLHLIGNYVFGFRFDPREICHIVFRFPWNLKKLTLSNMRSSVIPKGGELPNLVVLKISGIYFEEDTWDMTNEEWEFPKLEFLKLANLRIVRWISGSDGDHHFPCLRKLVLWDCPWLKEIPSCLRDITTLEMIEVHFCPKSIVSLFLKIKEDQKNNWGNEDIEMLTSYIEDKDMDDIGETNAHIIYR
ncbi:hypothetical protein ACH5RR_009605 [Cinchona calisaya]|uniref:Late blight resistance protein homolog R1A-3 n=1 Tax=Cinchona calisaya TaxID=153742 RepID=A0ABD3AIG7_9GENT